MILSLVELFAIIRCFGFYIKPSTEQLICDVVSFKECLILFKKNKQKMRMLLTFYFKTM